MTVEYVIKRDGRKHRFNKNKIVSALINTFESIDDNIDEKSQTLINKIVNEIAEQKDEILSVEQIQDLIEHKLMQSSRKDVAKAFILYRNERTKIRERNSKMMRDFAKKLTALDVQNQNANVDEKSFGGRIGEATSAVMKQYALDNCMSEMAARNHLNNEIYIHDLDHYAIGDHNCFDRNTKFLTSDGIKAFSDFRDNDIVNVLNMHGEWTPATVHYYGRQPMREVTIKRSGTNKTKTINCTSNHRWVLSDGTTTTNLTIGDRLITLKDASVTEERYFESCTKREAEMFCLGFIIADGCDHVVHNNLNIQVRLCGAKNKYWPLFVKAQYRKQNLKDSDDVVYIKRANIGKQKFLTDQLWNLLSFDDKRALFCGFMAADGSKTTNTKQVWTSDERTLEMIKALSAISGYYIYDIKNIKGDTNYKIDRTLYHVVLTTSYSNNTTWEVIAIKNKEHNDYEAWCVDEPITHTFTLDDGVVTGNCMSIPFDDLLAKGFNTRQTDVRPAQSVSTAFQLVAVIFQLQSLQQFGGVSATHIDHTMVPYVRKSFAKHFQTGVKYLYDKPFDITQPDVRSIDDKEFWQFNQYDKAYRYALEQTEKEIYQAVEGLFHNLNTLQSRSGNQLPFTSINFGTCTLTEGRMITKALLEVSIKGIGALHRTSVFPCSIFQLQKGVNRKPGDPNYDLFQLALKSTAQRLYPNYANVDWSGNAGYDPDNPKTIFSTMGCRTANGMDINGLGQLKDGRGNICPVTIILPEIAMQAKTQNENNLVQTFLNLLDTKIHEAAEMLLERFEWICSQSPDSAKFMYQNNVMAGYIPEEGIRSALKHGTIVIGQLGLAEALEILVGCNHTHPEGMKLAKQIEQLFKTRCAEFKEQYRLNFGVYYTPAENLCYKAMQKFKNKWGIIERVSDKDYFTNSMHVPVWEKMTPMEKIDIESQLTGYSSAGCITYVELPATAKHNIPALEKIVNYAMDHDIPYFAINVPNDMCMNCGYTDDINDQCPQCGSTNIQRLRRVTGYLTGNYKTAFNKGKQQETEMRVKHIRGDNQ